jgi:hypothetical protein
MDHPASIHATDQHRSSGEHRKYPPRRGEGGEVVPPHKVTRSPATESSAQRGGYLMITRYREISSIALPSSRNSVS